MATTRSASKIAAKWVRQTRKYFLKFLQTTRFPAGRTTRPAWEDVRVSRMVDHVDRGSGCQVQGANLSGHSPADLPVLETVMWAAGTVAAHFRKPVARALKKNRL